jgi:hypothetical protein
MFACTAESAVFQGMDWAARRASLRRLVPAANLAPALSLESVRRLVRRPAQRDLRRGDMLGDSPVLAVPQPDRARAWR